MGISRSLRFPKNKWIAQSFTKLKLNSLDTSCWCRNSGVPRQPSKFSVSSSIFQTDGCNGDLPGHILLPSVMEFRNFVDPAQLSTRPLLWTLQKTSKNIQASKDHHIFQRVDRKPCLKARQYFSGVKFEFIIPLYVPLRSLALHQ
ncbi:hypothetical protein ACTXT7_014342 [Hymenolepis weldensis]